MLTKQLIISVLATFFFLGLLGTAFAGENDYTSVLGSDEFTFNAPETNADVAARNHVYNQEHLAAVGTEAGDWEYTFNAPETNADIAARDHVYNQENLATIGTEAGGPEFTFESAEEAVAGGSDEKDAVCSNC